MSLRIVGQPRADLVSYGEFYFPDNIICQNRQTVSQNLFSKKRDILFKMAGTSDFYMFEMNL